MTEQELVKIGERLRKERKKKRLLQSEVAKEAGISAVYVRMIEGGKRMPSLDTFLDLTRVLGVTADSILYDELSPEETADLTKYEKRLSGLSREQRNRILRLLDAQIGEFENHP